MKLFQVGTNYGGFFSGRGEMEPGEKHKNNRIMAESNNDRVLREIELRCSRYYWNTATPDEKSFVQTQWGVYLAWLEHGRKEWLGNNGYSHLDFYDYMDETTRRRFLQSAGCPLYQMTTQPLAIVMDIDSDENIGRANHQNNQPVVPPSPERSANNNNNPMFLYHCQKYYSFDEPGDCGGNPATLAQARQAVIANYPGFLMWLETKREDKLTNYFTDFTWFRTLHENLKCSLLDNFSDCLWADNKYYFSPYNTTAIMMYMDLPLICKTYNAQEENDFFKSIYGRTLREQADLEQRNLDAWLLQYDLPAEEDDTEFDDRVFCERDLS